MTEQPIVHGTIASTSPQAATAGAPAVTTSRGLVAALFGAAVLAFLLPFGTVSCGTPVTFTGVELATAGVHGDDEEIVDDANGGSVQTLAILAAAAALAGLGLALVGLRGQGSAAVVALLALTLLPWNAALVDELAVRPGYVIATTALAAVIGVRVTRLLRARRSGGRRVWPAWTGLCLLVLLVGFTAFVCLAATASYGSA